jgi:hypothetical protein
VVQRPPSRRKFLKWGIGGAAALTGATVLGLAAFGYEVPGRIAERLRFLSVKEYCVLRAAAARIVGGDGAPLSMGEIDPALFIDGFMRHFDAATRRELGGMLQLIEHSPGLFGSGGGANGAPRWRRFTQLTGEQQDQVLEEWQSSSLTIRRQCFQGLRSLVFMGYYRDPRTFALLGYDGPTIGKPADKQGG